MEEKVTYSDDWKLVQKILQGQPGAWNKFVERFSNSIWKRAWELCREVCQNLSGNFWCIFYVQNVNWSAKYAAERPGCDEGVEIYAFIFDYLFNRRQQTGKLKFYDGQSRLETFISTALYGHLRTDWIRHKRKIRIDQITRPPEIKELPEIEQKVFDQMVLQRPPARIAKDLNLELNLVEALQEKITHLLMVHEHLPLILRHPEIALDDDVPYQDPMTPRIFHIRNSLDRIWERIAELIQLLPEHEKILLYLFFDQELDAEKILATCQEIHLKLPIHPRSGKITIHTIYQAVDSILKNLGEQMEAKFPEEVSLGRDAGEFTESHSQISVKGLKLLLKEMGMERKSVTNENINPKEVSNVPNIRAN